MQRIFHTPDGFRDIYQKEYKEKEAMTKRMEQVFQNYGYEMIQTPTVEYFEVFSKEVGTTPSKELYKFFDKEGNTMVLRPDFTPSIARAASTIGDTDHSMRLCYKGNTFVNLTGLRGRLREQTQMGVEFLGECSADADAEVIAAAIESLKQAGLEEFQISIGEVGFFNALLEEAAMPEETVAELRELISEKNYFGVEELVTGMKLDEKLTNVFVHMPQLFGSLEVLEKAKGMTSNPEALKSIARLEEINQILTYYGIEKYVSFDLGMVSKFKYYTGIIFQGFTYGTGEPIVKGGRYDQLLKHFGQPMPSVGFAIVVDQLFLSLHRQNLLTSISEPPVILHYHDDDRKAMIMKATELRKEGKTVILQKEEETKE